MQAVLHFKKNIQLVSYEVYSSTDTICSIAQVKVMQTQTTQQTVGIGCADIASYKKTAQDSNEYYAAAYEKKDSPAVPVFSLLTVQDGVDGYKRAAVYQNNSIAQQSAVVAFYYSNAVGKEWKYLTVVGADGRTPCDIYDSDGVRKAFKGTECFDSAKKKNVAI